MKAFEEWFNKNNTTYPISTGTIREERRKGWKAALEWVLSKSYDKKRGGIISVCDIKEELNGK